LVSGEKRKESVQQNAYVLPTLSEKKEKDAVCPNVRKQLDSTVSSRRETLTPAREYTTIVRVITRGEITRGEVGEMKSGTYKREPSSGAKDVPKNL